MPETISSTLPTTYTLTSAASPLSTGTIVQAAATYGVYATGAVAVTNTGAVTGKGDGIYLQLDPSQNYAGDRFVQSDPPAATNITVQSVCFAAGTAIRTTRGREIIDVASCDVHLVVDGVRLEAARQGLSLCFALPPGARDVWLMSRAARPCDVGKGADRRRLGLSLRAIRIVGGFATIDVGLDDPRLGAGFSRLEAGWRWTDGRARLPAALWAECVGPALLRLDLAGPALPHWVARDTTTLEAEGRPRRVGHKGA